MASVRDMGSVADWYTAWMQAEHAWSAELTRVYGKRAGDMRYGLSGHCTPTLKALYDEWVRCQGQYELALAELRGRDVAVTPAPGTGG
jgi:hypothetical protein